MRLSESLGITEEIISLNPVTQSSFNIYDNFSTANEFHGFDIGAVCEWDGNSGLLNSRGRRLWECTPDRRH